MLQYKNWRICPFGACYCASKKKLWSIRGFILNFIQGSKQFFKLATLNSVLRRALLRRNPYELELVFESQLGTVCFVNIRYESLWEKLKVVWKNQQRHKMWKKYS